MELGRSETVTVAQKPRHQLLPTTQTIEVVHTLLDMTIENRRISERDFSLPWASLRQVLNLEVLWWELRVMV